MRVLVSVGTIGTIFLPGALLAASGGIGDGFGADDWIAKWPVLLIVLALVVTATTLFSIKIFKRAKAKRGEA